MSDKIKIAVIGATGSVGTSVLDICSHFPQIFDVKALAAKSNSKKLTELGRKFSAETLCLTAPDEHNPKYDNFRYLSGVAGLEYIVSECDIDHVVFASSGVAAIPALQKALSRGINVSLANKESIVVAGPWVMPLVKHKNQLRPVDSEHSAVWQCLRDAPKEEISRIWLTASGGPFRSFTAEQLKNVKPEDALHHPVWKMGAKITIDSATLMNKGIECIEAMQLFGMPSDKVGALIHPTSQIHGMAEFIDGTVKLLMSPADMRLACAAAMAWPKRLPVADKVLPPLEVSSWDLTFTEINEKLFPCYTLAREAGKKGGAYPSVLIGADESAVRHFLNHEITFTDIADVINETLETFSGSAPKTLDDAISLVAAGERIADELCKKRRHK
ncbi:MAG: 1-deoxy-D-xylulose-5-phosphate reductoisomerase [Synergistes sp.]|nr:1-deoxy-D-xylulose-5-phosphate reductoisomerase [Synergistes sp.]